MKYDHFYDSAIFWWHRITEVFYVDRMMAHVTQNDPLL